MTTPQPPRSLVLIIVIIFTLSKPILASAQQGYALLIMISVSQASPGATIEVAGSHFDPDAQVSFVLFQDGNQTPLGTFTATDHGDFETSVLLPHELPFGTYEFRGVDEKGNFAAVPLSIVPDPSGEEGGETREEEDPLFSPMPTYAPGVSVTPMPGMETPASPSSKFPWVPVSLGAAVLLALFFVISLSRRKRGT